MLWLVLAGVVFLVACGQKADDATRRFTAALDKHAGLVTEGKFNKEDFKKEVLPITTELASHAGEDGKIMMSPSVKDKWDKSLENFTSSCKEKENFDAVLALLEVNKPLMEKEAAAKKKDK